MKKITVLLSVVFALLLLTFCSKKETEPDEDPVNEEYSQYSIQTIEDASEDGEGEYSATIGDSSIIFLVSDEGDGSFYIPNLLPGEYTLSVPSLSITKNIKVTELVLAESPKVIMDGYVSFITDIEEQFEDSVSLAVVKEVKTNVEALLAGLNENELEELAKFYVANEAALTTDLVSFEGGRFARCESCEVLFLGSVVTFTGSVIALGVTAHAGLLVPGTIALASTVLSYEFAKDFASQAARARVRVQKARVNRHFCFACKGGSNGLKFNEDEATQINIETDRRSFSIDDKSSSFTGFISFFTSYDRLNTFVGKLNGFIDLINKIPFVGFSYVDEYVLAAPTEETFTDNKDLNDAVSFGASGASFSVSKTVDAEGDIFLTITTTEPILGKDSVEGELIVFFNNDFNDHSEKFDMVFYPKPVDCNGVENGTATIDDCDVCSGGNTGVEPNSTCDPKDCHGDVGGSASIDECGVCSGGNTGLEKNATCTDCYGTVNGEAYIDNCGECVGGEITWIEPNSSCGTVTDIDGNVYEWSNDIMLENLKVTKYNDGSSITRVDSEDAWDTWGHYSGNDGYAAHGYGTLLGDEGAYYNYSAYTSGKLCPAGWHVMNNYDANRYRNTITGAAMKDPHSGLWSNTSTIDTVTYKNDFKVNPYGYIDGSGVFYEYGETSNIVYLLSYEGEILDVKALRVKDSENHLYDMDVFESMGMKVRCAKDD